MSRGTRKIVEQLFYLMADGHWRSIVEVSEITGILQATVSRSLRYLADDMYGGYAKETKTTAGVWRCRFNLAGRKKVFMGDAAPSVISGSAQVATVPGGKWAVIDANFLCHRAFHSVGPLAHGDQPTGIIFGFLMEMLRLQAKFEPDVVVICFDHGPSKRRDIYPSYKKARRDRIIAMAKDERARRNDLDQQIDQLRCKVLRKAGYSNILYQSGYEGDDMMAKVLDQLPGHAEAVLITSDHDMFQCMRDNVTMYSPQANKHYTVAGFRKQWGIEPGIWAKVKAIGGCSSDSVEGVPGVAEKTAVSYLTGKMNPKTATHTKITCKKAQKLIKHNMKVVGLPFKGSECAAVIPDRVNAKRWDRTVKGLGMDSLVGTYGIGTKTRARKGGMKRKGLMDG